MKLESKKKKVTASASAIGGMSKYGKYTRKWTRAFTEAGYSPDEATKLSARYSRNLGNRPYEDVQASVEKRLKNKKGSIELSAGRNPMDGKSIGISYKKTFK